MNYSESKKSIAFIIIWLFFMMFLSHQPGPETANTSGFLSRWIAQFIPLDEHTIHTLIRQSAHIILYLILSISVLLTFSKLGVKIKFLLFILLLISVLDEGTKPLIVGRHCDLDDILRNDLGVILGYIIFYLKESYKLFFR